jgi:hypothetical protein
VTIISLRRAQRVSRVTRSYTPFIHKVPSVHKVPKLSEKIGLFPPRPATSRRTSELTSVTQASRKILRIKNAFFSGIAQYLPKPRY